MMVKECVNIIMCTYNGEPYIEAQIRSILNQSYENIRIYIKDDGSSDNTINIIRELSSIDNRIVIVDGPKGLGYPVCFMYTLFNADNSEYYAFCDQDDVWNSDKVERAVKCLKKYRGRDIPILYFSGVDYCNDKLDFIRKSRFASHYVGPMELPVEIAMFGGDALGMTYVFNDKVRDALSIAYDNGYKNFKDGFIKIYCALAGNIIYEKESSALYRRHSSATTNSSNSSNIYARYVSMIYQLYLDPNLNNDFEKTMDCIQKLFSKQIRHDAQRIFDLFSAPKSFWKNIKRAFWRKRYRVMWADELGYRLAFFLGRF